MPVKTILVDNLLKWILPIMVASMMLLSGVGYFIDKTSISTDVYYCPPCGCSGDHIEHEEGGICEYCSMVVIEGKKGWFGRTSELVAQQYRGSSTHATFYSRFVYPTLFIGILLGVLSIFLFRRRSLELFLGLFVLVLSLFGLKFQMYGTGYGLSMGINTAFFPISFLMMLGPLAFFHSQSLIGDNFQFTKKDWLHFVPGILVFIAFFILYFLPADLKQGYLHTDFDPYIVIFEQFGGIASLAVYISLSYKKLKIRFSDQKKAEVIWLTKFYVVTHILMSIWLANLMLNAIFFELKSATLTYFSLWVTLCFYLYWIGFEVFRNEKILILKNFKTNKIALSEIELFKEKVRNVMETKKPYSNPSLTLKKLAENFDIKPKRLSGLINSAYQKNFYAFINEYRVEEVKKLLLDSELDHLTIVAIAEKAGFNSKSTFNSIFKKEVGMTPKEFKVQSSRHL